MENDLLCSGVSLTPLFSDNFIIFNIEINKKEERKEGHHEAFLPPAEIYSYS